jgi:predicted amidohydrolase
MLRIALAQDDFLVGHVTANRDLILKLIGQARDEQRADLIVFPELALTGYPPEDLLLRPGFMRRTEDVFGEIVAAVQGIDVVLPWPRCERGERFNSAAWIRDGRVLDVYDKWDLPNYAVFDEQRYFLAGRKPMVVELGGVKIGVVICEDIYNKMYLLDEQLFRKSFLNKILRGTSVRRIYVDASLEPQLRDNVRLGSTLWRELTAAGKVAVGRSD